VQPHSGLVARIDPRNGKIIEFVVASATRGLGAGFRRARRDFGKIKSNDSQMASRPEQETLDARLEPLSRGTGWVLSHRARRHGTWLAGLTVAILALAFWVYRGVRPRELGADLIWEQAERDFQAGDYLPVEKALERLKRLREPTPLDWMLRAQLAMVDNRSEEALADLLRVPDEHYMAAQARLLAGQIELRRDRVRFAEQWFRAALKLDPGVVQAHRELIYIYGMQLRRAELTSEFLALSKLTRLTFDNVFHWCLLRNNSWEPGEAIKSLSRYIAADPEDRWSRLALAENERRMGLHAEAESILSSVLPPHDPEAIALRAQIALDLQQPERVEQLLALAPEGDPVLARLRGRLALARRDPRTALRHFRVAFAADPDSRETVFGLLGAYEMIGDQKSAASLRQVARDLERLNTLVQRAAVATARRDPELMRELGSACAALHRDAEARAWYELAVALDPLDRVSQQALFRLKAASNPSDDRARRPTP
jgi:tetratricopeptide (TPR) repeat protein